jgi:8-oxo-dGTP pyrophosphatase MutT (NUDIX family)
MSALASAAAFTWSGFFANAAAVGTAIVSLGALVTVAEMLLRRWPRFRRWTLSAPLRVATARPRASRPDGIQRDDLVVLAEEFGSVRDFRAVLARLLFRAESNQAAGFILANLLAEPPASPSRPQQAGLRGEHHWTRLAPVLLRVFSVAARQRSTRLVARVLYPEDVLTYSALFAALGRALQQLAVSAPVAYDRYRPAVGEEPGQGGDQPGFASFVTAFTGSIVLADAAEARSGCAEQVLVWHSRRFHRDLATGPAPGNTEYLSWRYEDTHRDGVGCLRWAGERPRRIGDFDQRVLHLRSVALAEATAEDGLSFVLETSETCYGITEGGAAGMGCKGVAARLGQDDPDDPVFYRRWKSVPPGGAAGTPDYRIARLSPDSGRVTLLTVQLALISADDKLVLQDRSAGVRHDARLIGASAGGVVSLGGVTPSGDIDSIGWPDPTAAVIREAREETGVTLPPDSCRPLCVYLLNLRDTGAPGGEIPPGGQLGAAVLYLARTTLDSRRIELSAKVSSDQARGRFEHSGLAFCPLGDPERTAAWIAGHATRLSVHALMACTYTAMITFGRPATEAALGHAFAERPWWMVSPYAQPVPRLVRDSRRLMQGGRIDTAGPAGWAPAWQELGASAERLS